MALALVGLLLAGCVTLTPSQQRGLDETRVFVGDVARAYNMSTPGIVVGDMATGGAFYRRGTLFIKTSTLEGRYREELTAHELGHYLLGHDAPLRGITDHERWAEQHVREMDAHVKAVEILARVKGITERAALMRYHAHEVAAGDYQARLGMGGSFGHKGGCEEAAELLARFPQHAPWPGITRCRPPQ